MGDMLGLPLLDPDTQLQKQLTFKPPKGRNIQTPWNQDRINRLTELWNQGLSASQIGDELKISRNAVIGKAFRLKLPSRKPREWPEGEARKPRKVSIRMKRRPLLGPLTDPEPLPAAAPLPPKAGKPVDFEGLQNHHCRYIVSGDGEEVLYCGAKKQDGFPYCGYHARRCYNMPSR